MNDTNDSNSGWAESLAATMTKAQQKDHANMKQLLWVFRVKMVLYFPAFITII
jgi:hypothetical protein